MDFLDLGTEPAGGTTVLVLVPTPHSKDRAKTRSWHLPCTG